MDKVKKNNNKKTKKKPCRWTIVPCFIFWISWLLNLGLIGCLKMPVTNYHSMVHNISWGHRSHRIIWWCRPRFGWACSSSERYNLVQCGSALCTRIHDNLTYLSTKFQGGKNLMWYSSKYDNTYCVGICVEWMWLHTLTILYPIG